MRWVQGRGGKGGGEAGGAEKVALALGLGMAIADMVGPLESLLVSSAEPVLAGTRAAAARVLLRDVFQGSACRIT